MKTNDDYIKKALQQNIQRIDDDSFTNSIVAKHLAEKKIIKIRPFINFLPMIIGLSTVILSIGFILLIRQNIDWIEGIGFTENHGLIILSTSIIFLFYKLLEELTAPKSPDNTRTGTNNF
ncbi:MAG: hypothetical protein WC128_05670 [Bacteroidales bacterium]|jgi:ABC-type long-subunit fatty acid transport system fused permease/ATPase subunit